MEEQTKDLIKHIAEITELALCETLSELMGKRHSNVVKIMEDFKKAETHPERIGFMKELADLIKKHNIEIYCVRDPEHKVGTWRPMVYQVRQFGMVVKTIQHSTHSVLYTDNR